MAANARHLFASIQADSRTGRSTSRVINSAVMMEMAIRPTPSGTSTRSLSLATR